MSATTEQDPKAGRFTQWLVRIGGFTSGLTFGVGVNMLSDAGKWRAFGVVAALAGAIIGAAHLRRLDPRAPLVRWFARLMLFMALGWATLAGLGPPAWSAYASFASAACVLLPLLGRTSLRTASHLLIGAAAAGMGVAVIGAGITLLGHAYRSDILIVAALAMIGMGVAVMISAVAWFLASRAIELVAVLAVLAVILGVGTAWPLAGHSSIRAGLICLSLLGGVVRVGAFLKRRRLVIAGSLSCAFMIVVCGVGEAVAGSTGLGIGVSCYGLALLIFNWVLIKKGFIGGSLKATPYGLAFEEDDLRKPMLKAKGYLVLSIGFGLLSLLSSAILFSNGNHLLATCVIGGGMASFGYASVVISAAGRWGDWSARMRSWTKAPAADSDHAGGPPAGVADRPDGPGAGSAETTTETRAETRTETRQRDAR